MGIASELSIQREANFYFEQSSTIGQTITANVSPIAP